MMRFDMDLSPGVTENDSTVINDSGGGGVVTHDSPLEDKFEEDLGGGLEGGDVLGVTSVVLDKGGGQDDNGGSEALGGEALEGEGGVVQEGVTKPLGDGQVDMSKDVASDAESDVSGQSDPKL